jgi:hypothetical protein
MSITMSLLFGAPFFLAGLGLLWKGMTGLRQARQALHWPTAPGVITCSEIKITSDSDGDSYAPVVEYTYAVAGREYRSDSLWAGTRLAATRKFAATITSQYPLGHAVTVTYNPAKPTSAVLEPGKTKFAWMYVGAGALFVLIAVGSVLALAVGK